MRRLTGGKGTVVGVEISVVAIVVGAEAVAVTVAVVVRVEIVVGICCFLSVTDNAMMRKERRP